MDSPMVRATLQAGALSGLSNVLGQLIACYQSNKPYSLSLIQLAHFILFSLMACPPNYVWQSWLEAQFPAYRDKLSHEGKEKLVDDAVAGKTSGADTNGSLESRATKVETEKDEATRSSSTPTTTARKSSQQLNIRNTGTKFALDQTFGAAVNTVLFIAGIALLRGHDIRYVTAAVQADFWPLIFAGQRLWPLVSILSFTVIPFEYRVLFGSVVGLFWGIYLSLVSGGKK